MNDTDCLTLFRRPVREWFAAEIGTPTHAQRLAWPAIASGTHALVVAPTGSGKTLAAFLQAIDRLMFEDPPESARRCRVLYVSPLKALAVDIERNLRIPLAGIASTAERLGERVHVPRIAVRTGDTPGRERQRFARRPADILVTTPESLYLVLTSGAREALRSVRWVIVDEIHAVAGTKRGTHLALSLERLEELVSAAGGAGFQRIGLSATVRPLDEVARFLGGYFEDGSERPVVVADAGSRKPLDLTVATPERTGYRVPLQSPAGGGTWPAIHEMLLETIHQHRSTLIFVNNRRLAERLAGALNELAGSNIAEAHHGSVAKERRLQIEEDLKAGRLPALVATSSLELGIDMGAIDLVVQIESPPSVAAGLQRIGRAGHQVDAPSTGLILPKHRGDLLACAAVTDKMRAGEVEPVRYPRNPLDVLAQQIVAMAAMDPLTVDDVERIVRRAAPYHGLPRALLEDVVGMLSGRYPSHDFTDLRPRLFWNRADNTLTARENARRVAVGSGGTIPDRGLYTVYIEGVPPAQGRVGELEEIMVFESRVGDVFLLGASSWRITEITPDRVLVTPAPGVPGRMPFWHGEGPGRPPQFGRAIGALTRKLLSMPSEQAVELLMHEHCLTSAAALDLMDFLTSQVRSAGAAPDDRTILVEQHRDEMGEWRICILTPLGSRVLSPWAMAIGASLREKTGIEADVLWTEDGMIVRFPDAEAPPPTEWLFPHPDDVERMVTQQLAFGGGAARRVSQGAPVTAVFASHFREAAARALLLPQKRPGKRSPLWLNRKRAADLLHVVGRYPDFPIVLETFRECLQDVFDLPALVELLRQVRDGDVRVVTVQTGSPSPMATSLLFSYVANFMYEGDAPLAERRAQALTIDPLRLRQLLGEADMRDLLTLETIAEVEASLQCTTDSTRAKSADDVHDMLLRLGDLTTEEVAARSYAPGERTHMRDVCRRWLEFLASNGRVLTVTIGGEERWIAMEDAARYRDALGTPVPAHAAGETGDDPLRDLLGRYARTHGPFSSTEVARRFGLGVAVVERALSSLEASGHLLQGEFRPAGAGSEWCDAGVLKTLRIRSLARLRHEIEPVEHAVFARFLLEWHGVAGSQDVVLPAPDLRDAVRRLQGFSLPASHLEKDILALRVERYDPRDLDLLLARGEVLWTGDGRLGAHDGRVRLYLAEDAPHLLASVEAGSDTPSSLTAAQRQVYGFLTSAGASFFPEIVAGVGGFPGDILDVLWELVWLGLVSNDTLQPLRSLLDSQASRRAETFAHRRSGRFRPLPSARTVGGRPVPATASGRWFAVRRLAGASVAPTERMALIADLLLERHGVLTREAVLAESIEGGYAALYAVLKAMEETGRIRRGYFVEGLGASQFALPEAVERLRRCRSTPELSSDFQRADEPHEGLCAAGVLLASADPANPYGAALPWPASEDARGPTRAAGTYVVLRSGHLSAWLCPAEGRMLWFDEDGIDATIAAIRDALYTGRLRPFVMTRIQGRPATDHPSARVFEEHGFSTGSRGIVFRRPAGR